LALSALAEPLQVRVAGHSVPSRSLFYLFPEVAQKPTRPEHKTKEQRGGSRQKPRKKPLQVIYLQSRAYFLMQKEECTDKPESANGRGLAVRTRRTRP
jgi:hypothetical protein